jgi:hypothetical protein
MPFRVVPPFSNLSVQEERDERSREKMSVGGLSISCVGLRFFGWEMNQEMNHTMHRRTMAKAKSMVDSVCAPSPFARARPKSSIWEKKFTQVFCCALDANSEVLIRSFFSLSSA